MGPNGAGKTTTLRILATLLKPDSGTAKIAGFDVATHPKDVRRSIGYLSPSTGLYGRLTAKEMIRYAADLHRVPNPQQRVDALIEELDIVDFVNVRCDQLSTGMKQKVSIAKSIVHSPPVIIFDEPTTGLDVLVAQTLINFIARCRERGATVIFSTHIMREAEKLCDQLAIIHKGRILKTGSLEDLRAATQAHHLEDIFIALVEANS